MSVDDQSPEEGHAGTASEGTVPSEASAPTDAGSAEPSPGAASRSRTKVAVVVTLAVLVLAVIGGVVLFKSRTPSELSTGSGTAMITWKSVSGSTGTTSPPPQPFTGTIEGVPISGTSLITIYSSTSGLSLSNPSSLSSLPSEVHAATWKGALGDKRFSVVVYVNLKAALVSGGQSPSAEVNVTGTYGSERVSLVARGRKGQNPNLAFFSGTIGGLKVSGVAHMPKRNGDITTSTATFTVTQ